MEVVIVHYIPAALLLLGFGKLMLGLLSAYDRDYKGTAVFSLSGLITVLAAWMLHQQASRPPSIQLGLLQHF